MSTDGPSSNRSAQARKTASEKYMGMLTKLKSRSMPTMNASAAFGFSAGLVGTGTDSGSGGGAAFDFGTRRPDCALIVSAQITTAARTNIVARPVMRIVVNSAR